MDHRQPQDTICTHVSKSWSHWKNKWTGLWVFFLTGYSRYTLKHLPIGPVSEGQWYKVWGLSNGWVVLEGFAIREIRNRAGFFPLFFERELKMGSTWNYVFSRKYGIENDRIRGNYGVRARRIVFSSLIFAFPSKFWEFRCSFCMVKVLHFESNRR